MPTIKFIKHDGEVTEVTVADGANIMDAAIENGIDEIVAECGGACSCATCHCYIEGDWAAKVNEASAIEKDMLECVLEPQENSRLGCQVVITEALDGIEVKLPENQY